MLTAWNSLWFEAWSQVEHRASRSVPRRVERARCRDSVDWDGCSEVQDGADAKLYSEGCRECIEQAVSHDMSQLKLQEQKQRRTTEGHSAFPSERRAGSGALRVERARKARMR